jgi:hypothetical protein
MPTNSPLFSATHPEECKRQFAELKIWALKERPAFATVYRDLILPATQS